VFDIHGRSLVEPGSFAERFERLGQFLVGVLTERHPFDLVAALAWMFGPVAAAAWLMSKRQPRALRGSAALVAGYLAFFCSPMSRAASPSAARITGSSSRGSRPRSCWRPS
jgi:hypothetical protein